MYGTRDAAHNWEHEYKDFLTSIGFVAGGASPCYFKHPQKDLSTVVHGGYSTTLGEPKQLRWLRSQMEAEYSIKTAILGPGVGSVVRILNRVICWTEAGLTYEADPRHAEILIE